MMHRYPNPNLTGEEYEKEAIACALERQQDQRDRINNIAEFYIKIEEEKKKTFKYKILKLLHLEFLI